MSGSFFIDDSYNAIVSGWKGVRLDCGEGVSLTAEGMKFYMAVPANTYNNLTINVLTIDGKYFEKKAKSADVTRNTIYNLTFVPSFQEHEYVDLGLPSGIKWATCNVGASAPEEYGGYYAWGETETKDDYGWDTYKWCKGSEDTMTKYCTQSKYGTVDNKTVLDPEDDVAHVKWGGNWRMPTLDDLQALHLLCTWTWTTQSGTNGFKVTSNSNGNSIFLPATGFRSDSGLRLAGSEGFCLSGTLGYFDYSGYYFEFDSRGRDYYYDYHSGRDFGRPVRPVWSESVEVSSIRFDKSSLSLGVGDTYTLTATVSPSNATVMSLTWSSSDTSVATVSSSGKVSAIKAGTATITATVNDCIWLEATCSIEVFPNN